MNILINGSNRECNCYNILKELQSQDDELVSLSNQDIKYCLGCNACRKELENHCVLNDYITTSVYNKILKSENIILASPLYMSQISGLLKNFIDRLNPFYNHNLLESKKIYLILVGQGTYEDNEEEINDIIKWLVGVSEWFSFSFEFLDYFYSGDINKLNDVVKADSKYFDKIKEIKEKLS